MHRRTFGTIWCVTSLVAAVVCVGCANKQRVNVADAKSTENDTSVSSSAASESAVVQHGPPEPPPVPGARIEAISLLGEKLYIVDQPSAMTEKREAELAAARAAYDRDPHNEQAIIWLGRRLAYLGRFNEAIAVYTNGLAIHPDSARILRHRGHRYITIRMFNLAQNDLERAAQLVQGQPDEVEPDGQPNSRGTPTSTLQTNIDYHLGLAQFYSGDFTGAVRSFQSCLDKSRNDDMRAAASYWLFISLRRLGRMSDAAQTLAGVGSDMDIIENHSYHRLLLMFKNIITPEQVAKVDSANATLGDITIDEATVGYGIGVWHELRGERGAARMKWRQVIDTTNWAAFGYIASEVDTAGGR